MVDRRVEVLQGQGELFQPHGGPSLGRTAYYLEVWQAVSDSPGRETAGLQYARSGRLGLPPPELARLLRAGELQLHLADDRWLDLVVTSTDGTLEPLGPLRRSRR